MLGGKKIIGLCITKISVPSSHLMITSLNNNLRDYGYSVFVYSTTSDLYWGTPSEEGEKSVFDLIDFDSLDALVVMYEMIKDKELCKRLIAKGRNKGIPVFIVDGHVDGCININFDYKAGFERIVRHVIETHAVRRPHFMAGIKGNPFSEERQNIFKQVIEENGIPYSEDMVSYGDFWSNPTIEATEKLIARGKLPEAVICANDSMAVSVCAVMKRHCYVVPDDIIVTGFDGIDDVVVANPTISTYMCSNREIAEKIAEMLIAENFPANGADIYILPAEELGQSCGCVRESHIDPSEHLMRLNNRFNRYQGDENHMFSVSAKMLTCKDENELAQLMIEANMYDMTCVLHGECIDQTVDPHSENIGNIRENAIVLLSTDDIGYEKKFKPYPLEKGMLIPDLQKHLDAGDPLIFSALNHLNVPLGYVCYHFHSDDIENYFTVTQSVNILNSAIAGFRNMRYQKYLLNKMEEIYKHDRLTGLLNRNALVNTFEENADQYRKNNTEITFILADLDRLKYINDTFGHTEGDFAIHAVGDALRSLCPENAILARWGGDELVAYYEGKCDIEKLRADMTSYLDKQREDNDKRYEISSSVGAVTVKLTKADNLDSITKQADKLMYIEKTKKKKNRV